MVVKMCVRDFFVLFVILCRVLVDVMGYNLDSDDFALHRGEKKSMFGFSVASHSFSGQNWVLIGAPEAQSVNQPTVFKGGAVYFCPVDRDDGCREIPFDRNGNNNNSADHQIDEKSKQWFGATVNSGGPDKPIVACAPRYLWFTTKNDRRDPVGTCYVAQSDLTSYSEFSPCRTRHWGYHRQGTCQAGLGAAISKNGERLFIGAPGSWYWQGQAYSIYTNATFPYAAPFNEQFGEGQLYSIDPEAKFLYTPPRYSDFGAGQLYSQHLKKRPSVFFTKEGEPVDDDSYMGYSVTVGNFTGEAEGGLAAGMPRGNRLKGKVVMYTWNLTNYQNISGTQLGAYFGYAIAAADMNGDGLDDLIVGAPLHTEPNNEGKYEVGRFYVIYPVRANDDRHATYPRFKQFVTRDGVNSKGRFGLSVACLGDLDLDGYQDIAIGAPYDGPLERGAVYIYYGSKTGIREKASQVIYAKDLGLGHLNTFGFSVSGNGIDLDRNQYPDLVVGAYLSDSAFIFRSRPVINVEAKVRFNAHKKQISLEEKNCSLTRDKYVSCTSFEACVKYNGVGVNNGIELIMEFILDAKNSKDPRMFLYPSERRNRFNETWTMRRNDEQCRTMQVYIRDNTRDKLTPLEVEMRYSLHQRQRRDTQLYRRNPRSDLQPVLNGNLPSSYKDSIVIKKNCGDDDVCIPDLRLLVTPNVEKYLLGSGKRLKIDVKVLNEGEDSFESMFYMKVPPGINYFNTEQVDGPLVKCSAPSEATNNTLKCDIGNPLPALKMVHFRVLLDPYKVEGMKASYDFSMMINSTNPENNSTVNDNIRDLSVEIWVKTNISLTGWAQIPDIHYKEDTYKSDNFTTENEIGPQIVHIYSIKNNGPSDINEADVLFMWPSQTLEGDDLLYLMEQPEVQGKITCEFVPEANPLKVELLTKKYYLEGSTGESSKFSGGHVSYEEKSTFNVAITGTSHKHDEKKIEHEDKLSETGDGSLVHVDRKKESNKAERTQGQSSFGQSPSNNQGLATDQSINNYNIIYTSTGNQQGNQFEGGKPQQGNTDQSFSISQQSNLGQYDFDDKRPHGQQFGTIQTSGQRGQGAKQTGYFNWNNSKTDETQFGTVHTHQTGQAGQAGQFGNGGRITGDGEMVFTGLNQGNGSVYRDFRRISGYDLTGLVGEEALRRMMDSGNGEFNNGTHNIKWTTQNGGFRMESTYNSGTNQQGSGSVYRDFRRISGYDLTGLLGEEALKRMMDSGNGEFNNGTHNIKWTTQNGGFRMESTYNSGSNQQGSGSVYRDFRRISGYDLTGLLGEEALKRMMDSGNGEFNNGTHNIKWTTQNGGFRMESTYNSGSNQQGSGSVYRDFRRISGYDLTGLVGEEALRRMMDSGNGEFNNGTHNIKWTTQNGGFRMESTYNSGSNQQGSGSVYRDFRRISGYDLTGLLGEEALKRMMDSGNGEFNNGTHNIKWTTQNGGFRMESTYNSGSNQQGSGSVYRDFRRISGYDLTGLVGEEALRRMMDSGNGEFNNGTHNIKWTTQNGGFRVQTTYTGGSNQQGSVYRDFRRISGYDLTGLISEADLRRMMQSGNGEFTNGTHSVRWSTQNGGFRVQSANQQRGSVYSNFRRMSGYDLTGLVSEADLQRMMDSGSGEFNNGTHSIRWSIQNGGFRVQNVYNTGGLAAFREFRQLSGFDLTGRISEEDLRRMIQSGHGEFYNGTHKIKWTTQHGNFRIQNDTSSNRPYSISTEESVNQNLDEYTRRVQSNYGQYDQSGIGEAALGGGFRTTGLDLGVLHSNSGSQHGASHSEKDYGYYDPDLDSYEDRGTETHGHSGVSYGTSRTSSSGSSAQQGASGNSGNRHYESSYSYSSGHGSRNFAGDNVPTDHPLDTNYRNRLYRNKRQVNDDISNIIQCKSTKCSVIRCKSGPLVKDEEAWTALRFRGNAETLKKIGWTKVVTLSSMMVSRINKLPYIGTPIDRPVHTHEVFTNVTLTETEIKPDVVPLWVVVLSACAGTIILLLLIFLLYKCGFFKRNRPSDAPERQPLNRNGHYNGDEQL